MVLAPKGAGLYCSFEGWIRVMETRYLKFKDKVKYHSVIVLVLDAAGKHLQPMTCPIKI
jgi:hypothetical protein